MTSTQGPGDPTGPQNQQYQPYQQQPYQQPYAYQPPPPTNGLAIASMVVSILSLTSCMGATGFIGIILGYKARKQMAVSGEQGGGFATAGIVIGWVATAICVLFILFFVVIFAIGLSVDETSTSGDTVGALAFGRP